MVSAFTLGWVCTHHPHFICHWSLSIWSICGLLTSIVLQPEVWLCSISYPAPSLQVSRDLAANQRGPSIHMEQNNRLAERHRTPAPNYRVGLSVWLYTRDITLKDTPRKLVPSLLSPFSIINIINPIAVRLFIYGTLYENTSHLLCVSYQAYSRKSSEPSIQPPSTFHSLTTIQLPLLWYCISWM